MKAAVIVFPGSNCDRDLMVALEQSAGAAPTMVWHRETTLPDVDLIAVPGGFSYGDYLRSGAMAARSPIMKAVVEDARRGVAVLGVCNGFQILTESGLLPGVLMRNRDLRYVCRDVFLRVEQNDTPFSNKYAQGQVVKIPIAHHDGNFFIDSDGHRQLEDEGRIAFRYCDSAGLVDNRSNPNGSLANIAGVLDPSRRILGMMPHPERLSDPNLGGNDGRALFDSILNALS
ncbi:MAG: phosphoribosylformylglycinamidine synthase subunit PurQ [Proteobacteria bacterium]|nr:phosphoribosylformylglycinamidine synthase subunit PurQ [Pseudomonadota bacterium]MDA1057139.1 phosphoribosylformylglycinamidine synthase subunit PurQ [Pseudomonadota bacterium]